MEKKKFIKSVKALALCGLIAVSALSYTGCTAKANRQAKTSVFNMECCGKATLYNYVADKNCGEKKAALYGCKYYRTDSNYGRYTMYSKGKGIGIWTVKKGSKKQYNRHDGSINGNVITITI